jgi:hypothetical protein
MPSYWDIWCLKLLKTDFSSTFCISRIKQLLLLRISGHCKYHQNYAWAKFQIKIPLFRFFYEVEYFIQGVFSLWCHNWSVDLLNIYTLMLYLRILRRINKTIIKKSNIKKTSVVKDLLFHLPVAWKLYIDLSMASKIILA